MTVQATCSRSRARTTHHRRWLLGAALFVLGGGRWATDASAKPTTADPAPAAGPVIGFPATLEGQIQLLQTFADQAVIAIENGRLLGELQARTGELSRSVDQLTALGEVGQAVSSSLDLETVLDIARAGQQAGLNAAVFSGYQSLRSQMDCLSVHQRPRFPGCRCLRPSR